LNMAAAGAALMMCNPLLDISSEVPMSLLEKYGVSLNNAILAEDAHKPVYAELIAMPGVEFIPGGAGQNTARVTQWFLQSTPNAVVYAGCVGKDAYAEKMKEAAAKDSVDVQYMIDEATPTGTCAVLVHGQERSLIANLAAANNYKIAHLQSAAMQEKTNTAKIFYNTGFLLTHSADSAQLLAEHATKHAKTYCLNLSAPFIVEVPPFKAAVDALLPHTDYLFGNESEAAAFGKVMGWEETTVAGIAKKILTLPGKAGRHVVITQGADATIVATSEGVAEYPVPKVAKAEIVDTNGAGDAFVGGFIAQLILGKPIAEAVRCGHYAAGVIIRRSGCSFPDTPEYE